MNPVSDKVQHRKALRTDGFAAIMSRTAADLVDSQSPQEKQSEQDMGDEVCLQRLDRPSVQIRR